MSNIPSIIKIEYMAVSGIGYFQYTPGENIDITPYVSVSFLDIGMSGQANLDEKINDTKPGDLYIYKSTFKIAKILASKTIELNTLKKNYIFRLTDTEGQLYLAGIIDNPAFFKFSTISDGSPSGFRGYNCEINWQSINGIVYLV